MQLDVLILYKGANSQVLNPMYHSRTKHIDVRFRYVTELSEAGAIQIAHCASKKMIADILTKPLPKDTFNNLRQLLGVFPSHNSNPQSEPDASSTSGHDISISTDPLPSILDRTIADTDGKLAHTLVYSVGKSSIFKHTQLSLIHTPKLTHTLSLTWGRKGGVYIHFWHSYQESRHPDPEASLQRSHLGSYFKSVAKKAINTLLYRT